MKKLDQRQAWRFLAKKWGNCSISLIGEPYIDFSKLRYSAICICHSIEAMQLEGLISKSVENKLKQQMAKHSLGRAGYWWPRNEYGANERVKFCRHMAKICYKKG